MLNKTIIQGNIEFGNEKSYDKALKMFISRAEAYYKSDILFEHEEIFLRDSLSLTIPRFVKQVYDKSYKNTAALLEYIVQFGISGELNMWLLHEGKILDFRYLEPSSDKVAVQQYIKGKNLIDEKGKEDEAILALNKAIEKYNRHAQAYERRARVNFILKKYHDAFRDYKKSLGLDPNNPYAYYGRANVYIHQEKYDEALEDLQLTIKKSVALQEIHWKARKLKGKIHLKKEEYAQAEFELKLFTKRKFNPESSLLMHKREAFFDYGRILINLEKYSEAIEAFEQSLDIEEGYDKIKNAEKLRYRGLAKQHAGQNGFIKDIKEAANMGDKEAAKILEAYV
ncbi:MAG: tetratricopeptide repeat protein [Saprospiraceae bacterium]|nr:tetratricopeptide repeat protein [Saprospiraceae bacterium]